MSNGSFVPYHQRPNKAVDRQLFIDLLIRVNRFVVVSDYIYISFGGAYFEDFKLIHTYFNNQRMISIETDETIFKRQPFNLPFNAIKLKNVSSDEFISEYEPEKNTIIWLDYADARKHREQLNEFYTLLTKASVGDIVKITLNANPSSLFEGSQKNLTTGKPYNGDELKELRLRKLREKIDEYLPNGLVKEDMERDRYPQVLNSVVGVVARKAVSQRIDDTIFQPLTSFHYADSGNQMMTVTGILISEKNQAEFIKQTKLNKWELASLKWGNCELIAVPNLTAKEKFVIDQLLPCKNWQRISKKLGFNFVSNNSENSKLIEGYMKYYRYYPSFHKVNF